MARSSASRLLTAASAVTLLALGACSGGISGGTGFSLADRSSSASQNGGDQVDDGGLTPDGGTGGTSGTSGTGSSGTGGGGTGGGGTGGGGTGGDGSSASTGALERTTDGLGGLVGGVLATAGNAPLLNQSPLGAGLQTTGTGLQANGLAGLPVLGGPVGSVVQTADNTLNPLGKVVVLDQTVLGSSAGNSTQLVGVSALSPTQTTGQLATVGVLSSGQTLTPAQGLGSLASAGNLLNVSVGDRTLLGGGGSALIGASVLSPTQAQGTLATAGVLSGGSTSGTSPLAPVTGVVSGVTGAVSGVLGGLTNR